MITSSFRCRILHKSSPRSDHANSKNSSRKLSTLSMPQPQIVNVREILSTNRSTRTTFRGSSSRASERETPKKYSKLMSSPRLNLTQLATSLPLETRAVVWLSSKQTRWNNRVTSSTATSERFSHTNLTSTSWKVSWSVKKSVRSAFWTNHINTDFKFCLQTASPSNSGE